MMKQYECMTAAAEIRMLISVLTKLTRQEWQEQLEASGLGVSPLDASLMRFLRHHPFTISELSKHMAVEPASLVPVVDALERKTMIRRTIDPQDRRRTPLVLTPEGERILEQLPGLTPHSAYMRTLDTMGEEKTMQLLNGLRELASGMSGSKDFVTELSKSVRMQCEDERVHLLKRKKTKAEEAV